MTQPIARKRALEIAQECVKDRMNAAYRSMVRAEKGMMPYKKHLEDYTSAYAELAAALAYIENLARQKALL